MRTLEIAIMDLVYLLTKRQTYQSTNISFHDLLIAVDVINALTDKMKHTLFPEIFIIQSGENLQFSRDDIEKSHSHFDTTADQQLIHFMNNNLLYRIY
jgi:hypothetical protein